MLDKEIKTYKEAEEYIFEIPKFTKKNSIEATRSFYEKLGTPGEDKIILHVAGTNGKGSVCAYLNQIIVEAHKSVGMFTSPHLISMRERFRIAGEPVSEQDFLEAFLFVTNQIEKPYFPTFFELLFFMAMVIFEKKGVEYIILETGLGGRLDATNIIKRPAVTVITEIGLDHMQYLGDTIEKIAFEKAGIIKQGVPVVFAGKKEAATRVICKRAQEACASALCVDENIIKNVQIQNKSIDFSYKSRYYDYVSLTLKTCAPYQVENAVLALCAIEALEKKNDFSKEQLQAGVLHMKWEGRMEELAPNIYIDGAHNEDGINAFLQIVRLQKASKKTLLFSAVNDKAYEKMIQLLTQDTLFSSITITQIEGERAVETKELERIFRQYSKVPLRICEHPKEAFEKCRQDKGEEEILYIVGSLYLVGMIKQLFV